MWQQRAQHAAILIEMPHCSTALNLLDFLFHTHSYDPNGCRHREAIEEPSAVSPSDVLSMMCIVALLSRISRLFPLNAVSVRLKYFR